MKNKRTYKLPLNALILKPTTIAQFGAASLVKHFDGPYQLVGGTEDDCGCNLGILVRRPQKIKQHVFTLMRQFLDHI